ncbi:cadherin-like protein 26 isoform X2 [Pangasianodon hypophthalmus]|uniref:cadherin-like protein 26 isoform X2 n=1 Tax=Pangasianodon hypophthalmus TaxID=310915 RepID=UPI0023073542|nr:cadherin-like protein 26 isoform X2 [Pangasianodon hypophthalmus]
MKCHSSLGCHYKTEFSTDLCQSCTRVDERPRDYLPTQYTPTQKDRKTRECAEDLLNRRTASCTIFTMERIFLLLLLLLLAQWAETSHGKLKSQEEKNEGTSERVLIRSKRRWVLTTIELEEESPGPFPVKITELFNDKQDDYSVRFSISGQGVTKDPKGALGINEQTGEVYMYKPIDRETFPVFYVEFDVFDAKTGKTLDKTLSFNVAILDKNDNPPVFKPQILYIQVPENIKEGVLPFSLQASDKDQEDSDNSRISMKIVSQDPALPKFSLRSISSVNDSTISKIYFTGCFDYDKVRTYRMLVEARDHGQPSLSSTATVHIGITDSNTRAPVFIAPKYDAQVMEMETNKEILRIPVQDQDTPKTPASRAVFTILKGNEEGNYKIETDPVTNEGVLTVIKAKDYERTTLTELEIGVANEEPLFLCVDGKPVSPIPETLKKNSTVKVAVKVIDVNDPPVFQNKIKVVYRVEEEEPGDVLYTPVVTDEDSDPANIRYKLIEDPAKWMSIDPKTCKITLAKKMDRESPYVRNDTYTVVMLAIDDGEPPATGTGTLVVQLGDKNDNKPHLTSNNSVMCGSKSDRVIVTAEDADAFPFSGPFTFTLGTEDQGLKSLWRLEPSTGQETSLISLTSLPYGTYSIPLKIADHQGMLTHNILQVVVCDCGTGDVCQDLLPRTSSLHGAAIGILLGALLLMALILCFCFFCECQEENKFKRYLQFDGNQTLIAYNDEGGGSVCKADPQLIQSPTGIICTLKTEQSPTNHFGNLNTGTIQPTQVSNGFRGTTDLRNIYGMSTSWTKNSRNSTYDTVWSGLSKSFSFNMEDFLEMKLSKLSKELQDFPEYQPQDYSSEGTIINAVSLDKLSFGSTRDEPDLVRNLGPKFTTLDEICQKAIKEKNIKL